MTVKKIREIIIVNNAIFLFILCLPFAVVWAVFDVIIESVKTKKAENTLIIVRLLTIIVCVAWLINKF